MTAGPALYREPDTGRARQRPAIIRRLAPWAGPALGFTLFFAALHVLRGQLGALGYHEIVRSVREIAPARVLLALALTVVAYATLVGYDVLGLRYAGRTGANAVPAFRVALGSFVAYGLSQTLGFSAFIGSAVRYRFWSVWGLTIPEIARAAGFAGIAFTLGALLVTGVALVLEPGATLARLRLSPLVARGVGTLLVAIMVGFVAWSVARGGRAMRLPPRLGAWLGDWEFPVPSARLALAQVGVALLDWSVAAAVLYALLPDAVRPGFLVFTGMFVLAQFAGFISQVPGGLGVFDTLMVLLLQPYDRTDATMAALVAYRAVYYLLPFALSVALLAAHEAHAGSARVGLWLEATSRTTRAAGAMAARVGPTIVPTMASLVAFVAGAVLLFSGVTPDVPDRAERIHSLLPLGVIELSHLLGSVAGAALLVLASALRRRLDAAWALTVGLLGVGIVVSLLKGLDWEEAVVLALGLAALLPFRRAFYRKASLTAEPFEPGWVLAVLAVVGASVWLGRFSFQHVDYTHDLWWRFAARGDAPRGLRATVAASAGLLAFGMLRLLRHAGVEPVRSTADELTRARAILERSEQTVGNLALLGDKGLLFDVDGHGFVQYGVEGRSWIALGDPIGPPGRQGDEVRDELAWRLKEAADRHGGWPVFYEVPASSLPRYIDLGLGFLKLGEEARVELASFSLEGGHRKGLRRVIKDVEGAGARFDIVPAERVPAVMASLRAVSDDWLEHKRVREKGFSIGYFDEAYLRHFPVAVVRAARARDGDPGDIVAFANLWLGGGRAELSVDLMRFAERAPKSVMEYLFVQLMLWGKAEGYGWFNLGMAPLSGFEARELGPLWTRAGAWMYRHGEHFYNFQGLRQYKDKFDPVWEPRYLASPGGFALPRVLANVSTLISGGVTGLVAK